MTAWRLGLLGHPVAHSKSPRLHAAALESTGQCGEYRLVDVPEVAGLAQHVAALRDGGHDGWNVTVPYKLAAAAAADRRTPVVEQLGAANTLVRAPDGAVEAHNTDVPGLVHAVRDAFGDLVEPERVLVLGAGGAARAAVAAAWQLGARSVVVANRTLAKAQALVARMQAHGPVEAASWTGDAAAWAGAELVLQASSLGLGTAPGDPAHAAAVELFTRTLAWSATDARVYDLVYAADRAAATPAVVAARERRGLEASDGLGMLVHQAAEAFRLWTGVAPDVGAMAAAVEA